MGRKAKPLWEGSFKCPWCNNGNRVVVRDKVITKAIPAQKERFAEVEKDTQTTLDKIPKKKKK